MRKEIKLNAISIIILRLLLEGYKLYRVYFFIFKTEKDFKEISNASYQEYRGCLIIIFLVGLIDEIVLILIIITTIMCISNFNKGLKEMLIKQNQVANSSTQLSETI